VCSRESVEGGLLRFDAPTTEQIKLFWIKPPQRVLVLKKRGSELLPELKEMVSFLHGEEGMDVVVEPEDARLLAGQGVTHVETFDPHRVDEGLEDLSARIDFVVCLGGDGVILHASQLFPKAVPPVLAFSLGSLGFLTTHTFEEHREAIRAVKYGASSNGETSGGGAAAATDGAEGGLEANGINVSLRMRLRCEILRGGEPIPGKQYQVLNEVVLNRGVAPYLSLIECYEKNRLLTKVQADGVMLATATGSTAYSVAAGGSMVHPNVPAILFTPVCPHSLSFRPVILPDSAELELRIPAEARTQGWASFDGQHQQRLRRGDSVKVTMSAHPLPTINRRAETGDWFSSLSRCLNWNERKEQSPFLPGLEAPPHHHRVE